MLKLKKMLFLFILLPWLSNELSWSINKLKQGLWCTIKKNNLFWTFRLMSSSAVFLQYTFEIFDIYNSKIFKGESTLGNNYVYTRLLMLQLWYKKG